ncbi:MAG: hypothetical protein FJY74_07810 [Candidatus Eisenbacteria bacterium]|nr:hypothetical protein [Candidatus Eisenbacteria bacterium]
MSESVNEQIEFLKLIVQRLDSAGIPYMMTGSMAMAFYAVPRMTRDLDLVIECRPADAETIAALFQGDCYADRAAIRTAVERRGSFNIIHSKWMIKADFIVRKDDPYRVAEFARRRTVNVGGARVAVVAPEDLILSKLVWSREGDSDLQLRDAHAVADAVREVDRQYMRGWAARLSVADLLEKIGGA